MKLLQKQEYDYFDQKEKVYPVAGSMSRFMSFLGIDLLYFLCICSTVYTLSVPNAQGGKGYSTSGKASTQPVPDMARRSAARAASNTSYRAIFNDYPTIDKISRTEEHQSGSGPNKILDDNISLQNNRTDIDQLSSLKYALQTPVNSPLLISSITYANIDNTDPIDSEKVELHTNNHQSLNNHLSRHYNNYLMGNAAANSLHYSSNNKINNHKYGAPHQSSSNALANSLSLNYIHSLLLSKPTSASNSLSNLLNFNSNSLGLTTSPHGLPLQSNYGSSSYHSATSSTSANANSIHQLPMKLAQSSGVAPPIVAGIQNQFIEPNLSPAAEITAIGTLSCGKQQVSAREPRIVGGNSTYEGEFPWAVSIQRQGNHHCGGVIVGKRWILTAAHCVRSQLIGNLVVRTGGHTLTRSLNSINSHFSRDYLVDQIVVHDDFSRYDNLTASQMKSSANTNNADIALLRLKNDILWNELAWPVCFPNIDSGNFSGHDATVIGWGKLNEKSEDFSNELQKVKLTIIDNKVCQNWFRQAGRDMPIDDRIICAGFKNGGKDACHGDSGGPLLSKINGHYTVVGVVSTGIGCARPLLPGLYSRVSSYIRWIEKYVN